MADGVGGWAAQGVDPAIFARQLCKNIGEFFFKNSLTPLKQVLIDSVKQNPHQGSSTAVLASLYSENDKDILKTVNLGDSGYRLYRQPAAATHDSQFEQYFASLVQ